MQMSLRCFKFSGREEFETGLFVNAERVNVFLLLLKDDKNSQVQENCW